MKLIIDIDEQHFELLQMAVMNGMGDNAQKIIAQGTLIPDNATNGDAIKAMFPNAKVDDYDYGKDPVIDVYGIDDTEYITLRKEWWNAPYQKGGKE